MAISANTDESVNVDVDASGSMVAWWTLTGNPWRCKHVKGVQVNFLYTKLMIIDYFLNSQQALFPRETINYENTLFPGYYR